AGSRSRRSPSFSNPRIGAAPRRHFRPPSIRKAMVRLLVGTIRIREIKARSFQSEKPTPWTREFAGFSSPSSIARAMSSPSKEPLARKKAAIGRSLTRNPGKRSKKRIAFLIGRGFHQKSLAAGEPPSQVGGRHLRLRQWWRGGERANSCVILI